MGFINKNDHLINIDQTSKLIKNVELEDSETLRGDLLCGCLRRTWAFTFFDKGIQWTLHLLVRIHKRIAIFFQLWDRRWIFEGPVHNIGCVPAVWGHGWWSRSISTSSDVFASRTSWVRVGVVELRNPQKTLEGLPLTFWNHFSSGGKKWCFLGLFWGFRPVHPFIVTTPTISSILYI